MGVGEDHPGCGEPVDIRRGDLSFRIQTFDIPVTQVVGEDIDDVGPIGGTNLIGRTEEYCDK